MTTAPPSLYLIPLRFGEVKYKLGGIEYKFGGVKGSRVMLFLWHNSCNFVAI